MINRSYKFFKIEIFYEFENLLTSATVTIVSKYSYEIPPLWNKDRSHNMRKIRVPFMLLLTGGETVVGNTYYF